MTAAVLTVALLGGVDVGDAGAVPPGYLLPGEVCPDDTTQTPMPGIPAVDPAGPIADWDPSPHGDWYRYDVEPRSAVAVDGTEGPWVLQLDVEWLDREFGDDGISDIVDAEGLHREEGDFFHQLADAGSSVAFQEEVQWRIPGTSCRGSVRDLTQNRGWYWRVRVPWEARPPADQDPDADGVRDHDDECPSTPADQVVDPDGCVLPPEETDWVALGDSYSSGEGAGSYAPGTDVARGPDRNLCHRSAHAYAAVVRDQEGVPDDRFGFWACSGAQTEDVYRDPQNPDVPTHQYGEGPQFQRVSSATDVVTISIGGNDAGFGPRVKSCVLELEPFADCTDTSPALLPEVDQLTELLPPVYQQIRVRASPTAQILVLGYPQIIAPEGESCGSLVGLNEDERAWLRTQWSYANDVIETMAVEAGLRFVDVEDAFVGHFVCDEAPAAHGLFPPGPPESYHPNRLGHSLLAEYVAAAIGGPMPTPLTQPDTVPPAGTASVEPADLSTQPATTSHPSTGAPGELVDIAGAGYEPGSAVAVTLHSDPVELGTVAVEEDGTFATTVTIPPDAPVGVHTLLAEGQGASGVLRVALSPFAVATAPGAPGTPTVTGTEGGASIEWSAPDSLGGTPLLRYEVFRDGALIHTTADASTTSHQDTGLVDGVEVVYRVAAVNAVGSGPRSAPAPFVPADVVLPPHGFSDVPAWVEEAVRWIVHHGFATGFGDRYRPDAPTTRAQVARMLYRIEQPVVPEGDGCRGLTDVPAWARDAICWLVAEGHVTGFRDNTFRPDLPITRAQLTRVLYRVSGQPEVSEDYEHPFTDVPPWIEEPVRWITHDPDGPGGVEPIATGFPGNRYHPERGTTRAQVTRMLHRLYAAE